MEDTHVLRTAGRLVPALALAVLFAAPAALAQDRPEERIQELFEEAIEQLQAKDYDTSIASYNEILELLPKADLPARNRRTVLQISHYNLACAWSLKGEKPKALEHFAHAVENGFTDWDHINEDGDLDNIRGEARFAEIIEASKRAARAQSMERYAEQRKQLVEQISEDALFPFDFAVTDLAGTPLKLADMKGQVVLVDFWGTWCPPCRAEIPHLIELYNAHKDKGFNIVGLNREKVPAGRAVEHVREFASENGIPYRCAVIGRDLIEQVPNFRGFPTILLIDRQGRVRLVKVGYTEGVVLEAAIEKLLAEDGPSPAEKPEEPKRELF
jgi:thiol-disulfide isomerase/thioredoxin